jgi:Na+-driven multidrug efflux pump
MNWNWMDSLLVGVGVGGIGAALLYGPTTGLNGGWTGLVVFLAAAFIVSWRLMFQLYSDVMKRISDIKK